DDDGQTDPGIEVLARIEIGALADRTPVDSAIAAKRIAERKRQLTPTAAASDRRRRIGGEHRQRGSAAGTSGHNFHKSGQMIENREIPTLPAAPRWARDA